MNSTEIYNRFIAEQAAGQGGADVMWSSAMDLQVKLVDDGHAMTYASPEIKAMPSWAVYRNQAYGTTFEPAVFIYNKRLVTGDDIPAGPRGVREDPRRAKADKFKGKVTTYDIEKSGVGFMFVVQDAKYFPRAGPRQGLGAAQLPRLQQHGQDDGADLVGREPAGLQRVGLLRAHARQEGSGPRHRDAQGLHAGAVARDVLGKGAKNPNAAKLWLDYILSKRGQKIVANEAELFSIRADIEGEQTGGRCKEAGRHTLRPIPVSPEIAAYLDQTKRLEFLKPVEAAIRARK